MMSIRSRIIGICLLGLALFAGNAGAETLAIQGNVKGPDGKAISGAEVRIERRDAKAPAASVKTDEKGRYAFKTLPVGTYKLTTWVNKVPTVVDNVKTRTDGAVRVDFDIKAKANAGKKGKHMVYFPAQTGSHMGGQWVEVDETGNPVGGAEHLDKASGEALQKMQRNQTNTGH